jgi:hypothetical protein
MGPVVQAPVVALDQPALGFDLSLRNGASQQLREADEREDIGYEDRVRNC